MDIKRTILWITFSFSLLLLWDNWMRSNNRPSIFFPTAITELQTQSNTTNLNPTKKPVIEKTITKNTTNINNLLGNNSQIITITTDLVKANIDTLGGTLKRLELLKNRDTENPSKNLVLFDSNANHTYLAESGLIGGPFPNHKSIFTVQPNLRSFNTNNKTQVAILETEKNGIKLTKSYTFKQGSYIIDIQHTITNNSKIAINPSLYLQLLRDGNKPNGESYFYSTFTGPAFYTKDDHFQKISFEKIDEDKKLNTIYTTDNGWIALVQHYFVSAFIPPKQTKREIFTTKVNNNLYAIGNILPLGKIIPNNSFSINVQLYSGPQESAILEQISPGLELVKDYGWLTIIAKPIFWLMTKIYIITNNWGWTIILLTMLIKLLFFPLSAASYYSMAKMKAITPKITIIRKRYANDLQNMNKEIMTLYKTEKINPLGGCLPIVIQIPVFISLYWVLLASVEMRDAPWLGWIHNLAAPDPIYILPTIMAISIFIQTKLNPVPPDPVQAKIMLFMPIIFSIMFFFFPSGLVLYWVVNNILSIIQQLIITKNLIKK